jgi:hypothetical protein
MINFRCGHDKNTQSLVFPTLYGLIIARHGGFVFNIFYDGIVDF